MRAHRCGVGLVCLPLLVGCAMGGTYSHSLKTSADLQRDLEDCNKAARWAMDRGHIPSGTFADYLRYVDWCLLGKHGWRKIEGPGKGDALAISLIEAAKKGDESGVSHWIAQGADVNRASPWDYEKAKGETALYAAAQRGRAWIVRVLLFKGANPDVQGAPESASPGWTPLMIAAAERHAETVAVLLAAGAGVNKRNGLGRTALMFAALYGDAQIVKALLDRGADVNVVPDDETSRPALPAAAMNGHVEVVRLLLDKGADTSIRDREGRTALGWARRGGFTAVSDLLESRGATE